MKIALAQLNYHVGNFEANTSKIIAAIQKAEQENADLIVFSELAICGYPPRDFLEFEEFIEECGKSIDSIAQHCTTIAAIVGSPSKNNNQRGKKLYNSAYFLNNGKVEDIFHKTLLPNYDIFDEYRYFEPNRNFHLLEFKGEKIAVSICEDLWNITEQMYELDPMEELAKLKPSLIINIAASPFNYNQEKDRKKVLKATFDKYQLPIVYCNHVGAQTELIFDGGSIFINAKGELQNELNYFEEDFATIDTTEIAAPKTQIEQSKIALIHHDYASRSN